MFRKTDRRRLLGVAVAAVAAAGFAMAAPAPAQAAASGPGDKPGSVRDVCAAPAEAEPARCFAIAPTHAAGGVGVGPPGPPHGDRAAASGPGDKPGSVRDVCAAPAKADQARCFAIARTDVAGRLGVVPQVTPNGYGPAALQSAYALPSAGAGNGQTVAIVDAFDNPNAESDLAVYPAQFGLPPCTP